MTTYRTFKGTSGGKLLKRGGRTIGVFYPNCTDDEIDACLATLNDRADHGQPRQVG